jgi:hypothetical protein
MSAHAFGPWSIRFIMPMSCSVERSLRFSSSDRQSMKPRWTSFATKEYQTVFVNATR